MGYGIKLKVWGDYASFNRPEMKVERVSYDCITPSAARGILEAIYWKPQMRWTIDRIHVLAPIRFTHIRRNEIDCKISTKGKSGVGSAMKAGSGSLGIAIEDHRQQRAAMILCDVCYGIEAHLEVLHADPGEANNHKPEAKHLDIFNRRANKGQYFHHPYLGVREFPASFEKSEGFPPCPDELRGKRDLGYMLHDIAFIPDPKGRVIESNTGKKLTAQPRFFRAEMSDGVIDVPPLEKGMA
jgi:CRISPR-associated protein Cas5d